MTGPVTLVSAGPGYGKTLALADWARRTTLRVAWLSVEASDDSLPGFWSALLASLRAGGVAEPGTRWPICLRRRVSVSRTPSG